MVSYLRDFTYLVSVYWNAEFIPSQRRRVQEHRNNLNAYADVTLKRHKCRAPLERFICNLQSRFHTAYGHDYYSRS